MFHHKGCLFFAHAISWISKLGYKHNIEVKYAFSAFFLQEAHRFSHIIKLLVIKLTLEKSPKQASELMMQYASGGRAPFPPGCRWDTVKRVRWCRWHKQGHEPSTVRTLTSSLRQYPFLLLPSISVRTKENVSLEAERRRSSEPQTHPAGFSRWCNSRRRNSNATSPTTATSILNSGLPSSQRSVREN